MHPRFSVVLALALAAVSVAPAAEAFCGFYVGGADTKLVNNATMVVLMREGTRTVLSMQNNYQGPPSDFAMVVPVPVVLQKDQVKTLPRDVFDRVDELASPRLVEYWEQDPCPAPRPEAHAVATATAAMAPAPAPVAATPEPQGVKIEAQFAVGEYEIVILSARDSGALDGWLRENGYKIPPGAEPVLRPYVQAGSKFFVAKVDAKKVTFQNGEAVLSPLRFHYDSDRFELPVRLGLLNSAGSQDLVVHILARNKRYEVQNYPNVTIPTNHNVAEEVRDQFGPFYAALFDQTLEKNPRAVVTEYAWDASSCDPCPGPALQPGDIVTLGVDALPQPEPPKLANDPTLRAEVTLSKATSSDKKQDMAKLVEAHKQRFAWCYTEELARTANPRGQVKVALKNIRYGMAREVKLTPDKDLPASLVTCVQRSAQSARFGYSAESIAEASFTVGFSLKPGAPGQGWYRPPPPQTWGFTLTRLHSRYSKDALGEDLVFKEAPAITGGREEVGVRVQPHDASPGSINNFQARYTIRHPWTGPMACEHPRRGVWGGPPAGVQAEQRTRAAKKIAFAPHGQVALSSLLREDIPAPEPASTAPKATADTSPQPPARGCGGCSVAAPSAAAPACSLAALAALGLRRRRKARSA